MAASLLDCLRQRTEPVSALKTLGVAREATLSGNVSVATTVEARKYFLDRAAVFAVCHHLAVDDGFLQFVANLVSRLGLCGHCLRWIAVGADSKLSHRAD